MMSTNKQRSEERSYKFLGINKRYLQTYTGLLHATSSIVALLIGNYLFLQCILLGNDVFDSSSGSLLPTIFHVATFLSGSSLLPFWKKVQSYQHSTTSMKEKGLTPSQMQNFNRGRGILALILSATIHYCTDIYPMKS